jgi:hypothetical protein
VRKLAFRSIRTEGFFCEVPAKGAFEFTLISSLIVMILVMKRVVEGILEIHILVSFGGSLRFDIEVLV